jgi:hypothetical protein
MYYSPLVEVFANAGLSKPDFALFWDYASLFQNPRIGDQNDLFGQGLKASNVWYGHEQSVCWMQTELPKGFVFEPQVPRADVRRVRLVLC